MPARQIKWSITVGQKKKLKSKPSILCLHQIDLHLISALVSYPTATTANLSIISKFSVIAERKKEEQQESESTLLAPANFGHLWRMWRTHSLYVPGVWCNSSNSSNNSSKVDRKKCVPMCPTARLKETDITFWAGSARASSAQNVFLLAATAAAVALR